MTGGLAGQVAAAVAARPGSTLYELTGALPAPEPADDGGLFPAPPRRASMEDVLRALRRLEQSGRVRCIPAVGSVPQRWDPTPEARPPPGPAAHRFSLALKYRDEDDPAQTQLTPGYILDPVRAALGGTIALDPCTTADNPAGAEQFYCPPADGAAEPWQAPAVYCNPPYGQARERWVGRCIEAGQGGARVVLLIPAATDTRIFQQALATATAVVFIQGRVKFAVLRPYRRQAAASHPSALLGWNTDLAPCAHLGARVVLRAPVVI